MFGGISATGRMLVVADAAGLGEVCVFDLDDRRIASRFTFRGADGGYADVGGIALAADSSLWVPDTDGNCVRRFSLFGNEVDRIACPPGAVLRDRRGLPVRPRAVCLDGAERLWVACGDRPWVHGLQVFQPDGRFLWSLPAFGQRERTWGPALGLARENGRIWIADAGNDAVQCFREDGGFLAAHEVAAGRPVAVASWPGGCAVLAGRPKPELLLYDRSFRRSRTAPLGGDVELQAPSGLAVHGESLLVLDRDAERVVELSLDGELVEVLFDRQEWE